MASSIIQEFNIKIEISFYEIDIKVIEALKISIESKEKDRLVSKGGHLQVTRISSGGSGSIMGSAQRGTSAQRKNEEFEEEEEKQQQKRQPDVNLFGPLIGGMDELMISESDLDAYALPKLGRTHT